jgi:glycosyltransferase involved in cell wall biosynthesis
MNTGSTNKDPLVSVLMTAYNREKYIGEAIQSVIHSTYPHWELIIVDDGSTDETVNIAREFASKDHRIRVYVNEKNLGDYPNRNKAAEYSKGEYLKYVDSDDLLYPHCLDIMVHYMEKFPAAGYGIGQLPPNRERPYPILLGPEEAYEYNYFKSSILIKSPLFVIFRKSVFLETGGFPTERMTSDYEMWHLLSQKHAVLLMPQDLAWYRRHGEQEISDRGKFTLNYLKVTYKYIRHTQCPLNGRRKKLLLSKLRNYKIKLIYRSLKRGRLLEIPKIIKV